MSPPRAVEVYQLRYAEAASIVAQVAAAVDDWAVVAAELDVSAAEMAAMAGAFDRQQREFARAAAARSPRKTISLGKARATKKPERG